ncbi:acetyltransferase (isoleucine patch superfamily) protein [Paenibacillus terrae HPL-003]|uniref:Acetyltransferase (Isoleucine patch superfamily) protein n=1 Tax=Paenibacillus terrae (strain HPL-003) TaxID=985665 RepID=G7VVM7_PAETH|nr:acetyltransferase [Paenibacillus terrae]AET57666.1 acetyltransferase (isoleucine patch superfamily) protein [Paenibacillus terrae HPL-003]
MSYIVFGAGGHGKVVVDILRSCQETIAGMMDDGIQAKKWNGLPNLGGIGQLDEITLKYPEALYIVAIGNNSIRMNIVERLKQMQVQFGTAIHSSAVIGSNISIGEGTVVMPNAVINADTHIGEHVIINTAATIDHDCCVEHFAHISPGVHVAGGVTIGCRSHVGISASLIPGVSIGKDTIIGAASCVIRDLPDHVVAVGCPARVIKNL